MSELLICCSFPEEDSALAAARAAVAAGLAACCQVGSPMRSIYRWEGRLEEAREIGLTCKTTTEAWSALRDLLKSLHPYEVPEIVALPLVDGWPAYLSWVRANAMPGLPQLSSGLGAGPPAMGMSSPLADPTGPTGPEES